MEFTHEALLERGFNGSTPYIKEFSGFYCLMVDMQSNEVAVINLSTRQSFFTTITTLEELDLFLGMIKHEI